MRRAGGPVVASSRNLTCSGRDPQRRSSSGGRLPRTLGRCLSSFFCFFFVRRMTRRWPHRRGHIALLRGRSTRWKPSSASTRCSQPVVEVCRCSGLSAGRATPGNWAASGSSRSEAGKPAIPSPNPARRAHFASGGWGIAVPSSGTASELAALVQSPTCMPEPSRPDLVRLRRTARAGGATARAPWAWNSPLTDRKRVEAEWPIG